MGAKSLYLDNREKYREQITLAKDIKALEALDRGFERWRKYKNTWEEIDLDSLVEKLFKNPVYTNTGQKFEITDLDSIYIIYCDNSGSYFKIGNKTIPKTYKGHFLDKNLNSVLNEKIGGKISGTLKERREELSHFRMKIKKR